MATLVRPDFATRKIKTKDGRTRVPMLLPVASELQGAVADGGAEGLVCRGGVEPFGLGLALVTQEVNQTQSLTLRSQFRRPRPRVPQSDRLSDVSPFPPTSALASGRRRCILRHTFN